MHDDNPRDPLQCYVRQSWPLLGRMRLTDMLNHRLASCRTPFEIESGMPTSGDTIYAMQCE